MRGSKSKRATRLLGLLAGAALLAVPACGGDGGPTPPPPPPPPPGPDPTVVDLQVGESEVFDADGEILALEFPEASSGREYRLAVQSGARSSGSTSMRLILRAGEDVAASRTPTRAEGTGTGGAWQVSLEDGYGDRGLLRRERIRRNALREAERVGAFPRRPRERPAGTRLSLLPSDQTPAEGDTLRVRMGVQDDLSISCSLAEADTITGVVRAVGEKTAIVEDTLVDPEASAAMNYDDLIEVYDADVLDALGAYFADPTDIDGNGRVLVVFTPTVNELTEEGADARVVGFFLPTDLADSGDPDKDGTTTNGVCEAGNEAELVYLLAPDIDGDFGDPVFPDTARRNGLGVSAHELYHLVSTGYRLIEAGGQVSQLEDTWLDEGLAHVAEEIVGFRRVGLGTRDNHGIVDVADTEAKVEAFNNFHIANFSRLRQFMRDPSGTNALSTSDVDGGESLKMRGFGWIFLRWLADQEAPDGSGFLSGSAEDEFFRSLAQGGPSLLTGIENIESATGKSWEQLIAEFAAALQLDDDGVANVSERETVLTWDLRDVFAGLNDNIPDAFPEAYPLRVEDPGFVSDTLDFDVQASAQKYVTFDATGSTPRLVVRLLDQADSALPASAAARIVVVRTN
ncbi:MAG: hypothetical protein ACOC83_00990 [Gemmatimonadota bacterium]